MTNNKILYKSRKLIRHIILSTLGRFSKPTNYVHILNGHMIDPIEDNYEAGERFGKLLSKLNKHCDFLNIETAINIIINKEKVNKPTIAFTFDDGWRDCYTQIAPQLDKYGVNAMFFINPNLIDAEEIKDLDYIENFTINITNSPNKVPMTWNQIRDLQERGYLFGAHTLDHYCINDDDILELEHQIGDCKKVLEEKLEKKCEHFAFPFGRIEHANNKSIDIACKHYKYVFSQSDHKHFFSYNGRVINRRHFEPFWPISHILFFISSKRK